MDGLAERAGPDVVRDSPLPAEVRQAVTSRRPALCYRRNGMSIFVLLLYAGYAVGKVAARLRSSTVPQ